MQRADVVCFLAALALAVGCASTQMTQASVALPFRLESSCVAAALRSESEVVGFRELSEAGAPAWRFQLADPALVEHELPAFVARQDRGAGAEPSIEISSTFSAGSDGDQLRVSVMQRQQAMLSRVVQQCAGRAPHFGLAEECGKGEGNTLCVRGELR